MAVNPILKDYLNMNPLVKGSALKILPHLYQHEISDIIFNTLYKGSFDKNIFVKRICILSFYKLFLFNEKLGDDIKEVLENFIYYRPCVSGLSLIVFDYMSYDCELDWFHSHFRTFCRNLHLFSIYEICFVIRFMNLYVIIFLKKNDKDYIYYTDCLKKCLFINNMEMTVEICKHFWNFEEYDQIDIILVNLLKYLNSPVPKKKLLLSFYLEILKTSENYHFELLEENYFYFFFFERENIDIKILKIKIMTYLINKDNHHEIFQEALKNLEYNNILIKKENLILATRCIKKYPLLEKNKFIEILKSLKKEKKLLNEIFKSLSVLSFENFKNKKNEFFKMFSNLIFSIHNDNVLIEALNGLEKLINDFPDIINKFLIDFWKKKFDIKNLKENFDLKKLKYGKDSYLDFIFFQFHFKFVKIINKENFQIEKNLKKKINYFFEFIIIIFIQKKDIIFNLLKQNNYPEERNFKKWITNLLSQNFQKIKKEIKIKKEKNLRYLQFGDLSEKFPKLRRKNIENIKKSEIDTSLLRIEDNQEKLKKIIQFEKKISNFEDNNNLENGSVNLNNSEISNFSYEEAPEEANDMLDQFLKN